MTRRTTASPSTTAGNVTRSYSPGAQNCISHYVTGAMYTAFDFMAGVMRASETLTSSTNYAAPATITTNSLTSTYAWSGFLAPTSVTGPNTESMTVSYDGSARPSQTTSPHGAVTNYGYSLTAPHRTATTNNKWVKTTLDGLGRPIKVEAGYGTTPATTVSVVDTEYDVCACTPMGRVKRVSQPHAPGGTVYWTTYTYDGMGRTLTVSHPNGTGTTTYSYSANTVTVTDPTGKWKKYVSDAMGNLTQVIEPNPAGGADLTSNYTYNVVNQLTQVSMTRGAVTQTRTFNYDSTTLRLMSATNPETGTVSYTYNANGTVATKTDAKGQQVVYTYDGSNRLTQAKRYASVGGIELTCERTTFYYDTNPFDGTFSQYTIGRPTAAEYSLPGCWIGDRYAFKEMYSYTRAGLTTKKRLRVTADQAPANPRDLDAVYTYDNEGKMTAVTYPTTHHNDGSWVSDPGTTFTYTFDDMGRPNKLNENDPLLGSIDWVKDVLYGVAGQMTQMKYLSTKDQHPVLPYVQETRQYNERLQLTRLTTNGTDMEYRYSATQNNGRITQQKD